MKLHCGRSAETITRLGEWHRWFAWRPVRVATGECRWLETIERRAVVLGWNGEPKYIGAFPVWKYRTPELHGVMQ